MNSDHVVSGSPTWQLVFFAIAACIILLEVLRGWRLGLFRQLVRVIAVVVAYATAWFGGPMAAPLLRPIFTLPDFANAAIGGAILALIAYALVSGIGNILFKRTGQQSSGLIQLIYGLSGAAIGVLFGAFLVWLAVVGIRLLGTVAESQIAAQTSAPPDAAPGQTDPFDEPALPERKSEGQAIVTSLARLKNSLELGDVGAVVKEADVVPDKVYTTLSNVSQLAADPERARRFLDQPGAQKLSEHPRMVALREDPEITDLLMQGSFFELLQHPKVVEAANDPTLRKQLAGFDLNDALQEASASPTPAGQR